MTDTLSLSVMDRPLRCCYFLNSCPWKVFWESVWLLGDAGPCLKRRAFPVSLWTRGWATRPPAPAAPGQQCQSFLNGGSSCVLRGDTAGCAEPVWRTQGWQSLVRAGRSILGVRAAQTTLPQGQDHCSWPSAFGQWTCFCAQVATAIPPHTTLLQWPPS